MSEVITVRERDVRLHGKLPRIDHIQPSYAILARDGILARVKNFSFFTSSSFHFTSNKSVPIQPESIPFCGVYLLQEFRTPDGDANAGEIRFRTSARYGFSIIVQNNNAEEAEYNLDRAYQSLTVGLFSDSTLYNNSQFKIQSFIGGMRQHVFGHISADQQSPIAELRWELMCDLGVIDYPPDVPDVLEVIHLETRYPAGSDPTVVQQVTSEYDMEQNDGE